MRRGPESVLSDFVDEATAHEFAGRVRDLLAMRELMNSESAFTVRGNTPKASGCRSPA